MILKARNAPDQKNYSIFISFLEWIVHSTKILAPSTKILQTNTIDIDSFLCITFLYCTKDIDCAAILAQLLQNGQAPKLERIHKIISKICRLACTDLVNLETVFPLAENEEYPFCSEREIEVLLEICNETLPRAFML